MLLMLLLRLLPVATAARCYCRAAAAATVAWQAHSKADLDVPALTPPHNLLLLSLLLPLALPLSMLPLLLPLLLPLMPLLLVLPVVTAACRYRCDAAVAWQAHIKTDLGVPELT